MVVEKLSSNKKINYIWDYLNQKILPRKSSLILFEYEKRTAIHEFFEVAKWKKMDGGGGGIHMINTLE